MTKKRKMLFIITILSIVFLLLGLLSFGIYRFFFTAWESGGELVATSVSPGDRWKVQLYYLNPGAMGSGGHRAEVVDLKGKLATRNIYHDIDDYEVENGIRWKDPNTVVLNDHEIDVRTGSYEP